MQRQDWRQGTVQVVDFSGITGSGAQEISGNYRGATFIRAQLQVFGDYTGDTYLAVFVEDTLDRSTWHEIGKFSKRRSAGTEIINITQPFTDTLRVRWEIEGQGVPTFTFRVDWYVE